MAGDWIKIEHTTPDKPEVVVMAEALKLDPDAVVGKLLRIWIWADLNSIDGNSITVTDTFLDRLTHRKGFAAAMRSCGWLSGVAGAVDFPGFDRHNGRTAKGRAETNRRVAKHRKGNASATWKSLQKQLPEKRREDITTTQKRDGDASVIEEIRTAYFRKTHMREAQAAIVSCLKRHPGREAEILAGTKAVSAVVAQWSENEKLQFVKQPVAFFEGDHWADDPQFWRSQREAKTAEKSGLSSEEIEQMPWLKTNIPTTK